ncbi:hypothetical protein OPV22_013064 [Ensete ventricosum]|uniref:Uncharacterized protein n=1 Tax=Ensete ventricosum TaxID=4639 RepID=A0AAV8R069_ENSVE|nr:hypothetical protein OPV22_013064 [Ensete ventricosum]
MEEESEELMQDGIVQEMRLWRAKDLSLAAGTKASQCQKSGYGLIRRGSQEEEFAVGGCTHWKLVDEQKILVESDNVQRLWFLWCSILGRTYRQIIDQDLSAENASTAELTSISLDEWILVIKYNMEMLPVKKNARLHRSNRQLSDHHYAPWNQITIHHHSGFY